MWGVSQLSSPIEQLLIAKSRALLHDPPNKMWVLRKHEEVAEEFRKRVVKGTILRLGLGEEYKAIVIRADRMASTFDRWLINTLYADGGVVVEYYRLHNILRPDKFVELSPVTEDEMEKVAEEINEVLIGIEESALDKLDKTRLLYSTLYFLLEVIWYSKGLSPSLADTRTPTHTVFDHLYATASVTNLNFYDEPKGFIVRIDVPGVQAFISASRKTSDFWAGSWILSQLMWGLVRRFIDVHGPDVVLTPTLRLNPYFFKYLINRLEDAKVKEDAINKLCKHYVNLISRLGWGDLIRGKLEVGNVEESCGKDKREKLLEMLTLTPLIPATAYLVLPPFATERERVEDVRQEVLRYYLESWHELVEGVANKLAGERVSETRFQIIRRLLDSEILRKLIELPHIGIRVDVVNVGDVYVKMLNCLRSRNEEICRNVGLELEIVEELLRSQKELRLGLEGLAKSTLWHMIMTHALAEEATKSPIPIPRPFWMLKDGELEPIGDYRSLTKAGDKDWSVCSLCGEEPAIIHPVKMWNKEDKAEDFEGKWFEMFSSFLNIGKIRNEDLEPVLRPGEALGSYCLFKRIVGEAYSEQLRKYYGLASTDDVALVILAETLKRRKEILKKIEERCLEELKFNPLPYIIGYNDDQPLMFSRDIARAAKYSKLGYETFKSRMSELFREHFCSDTKICVDLVKKMFPELQEDVEMFSEITVRPGDIGNFLKLRTRYSIVKGDGDFIGMIHQGVLEPANIKVDDYVKILLEAVSRELDEARREGIARAYYGAIRIARILTGSANSILVSPTLTSVISLALQVTALRDVASIIRNKGFPVYSGGDDVLALTPIERWFEIVRILRSHFWGDEESLFHRIRVGGRNVVIAQAIPTGRSFSVRVADILDIMSHEISIALELLESKAKNAKWVKPYGVFKDSLVLSDSRSGVEVVFPLSMTCGVRRVLVADRVLRTLETMFIAENLGVISSNIPEDLVNMLRDPLTGEKVNTGDELLLEALLRMFKRTLYRNIHVRKDEAIKFKMDPFEVTAGKIVDGIGGDAVLSMWNNDRRRRLLEELVDFVRASRGWL